MNQKANKNPSDFIPLAHIHLLFLQDSNFLLLRSTQKGMEPAKIDWKTVESVFVVDSLYEHINAPKWVDLSAPLDPNHTIQDEAWFCRPDCKHPKTADDFYKLSAPTKLVSMVEVSDMLQLSLRNKRDAYLKQRQPVANGRIDENCENNDPKLSIPPPISQSKFVKEALKSSADHKMARVVLEEETPKLKSTRPAKNLSGRDIFSHFTEFCNELKKLAIRAKDKENEEGVKSSPISHTDDHCSKHHDDDDRMDVDEVARMPLTGISKVKFGSGGNSGGEKLRRKKGYEEAENTPLAINLNSIRNQESQKLLKIRTNPPSPQCFSAVRGQVKGIPTKDISASKSKFMERSILQEVKQGSTPKRVELPERSKTNRNMSLAVAEKEAKPLDMFWFLKQCTLPEASS